MKFNNFYRFFSTVLGLLFFIQMPAHADMQEISGVPFFVDKIEYMPDDFVMLSYEDSQKIVNKDNLNKAILDLYFGSEAAYKISSSQLKKFISNSLINSNVDYAKIAVKALIEHSLLDEDKIIECFEGIPERPESLELLHYAYSLLEKDDNKIQLKNNIFLLIGVKDSKWLSEKLSELSDEDKTILEKIDDTYFGATFFENDANLRNKILFFEKNVFGPSSSIYQKHVDINKNVALILPQLQNFNFSSLHRLIQLIQYDRNLHGILMPFVRDHIHACVKNALELGKIDKAIEAISLINKDWRTEDTVLLVKRILKDALQYKDLFFIESSFNDLVSAIASQDQKIKQDYLDLLSREVDILLENKRILNIRQIVDYIVRLRPDPNQDNDIIRAKEISFLVKNGQKKSAKAKLTGIRTSLPLMTKLNFAMSGLYFNIWKYLSIFVLLVIAFILLKPSKDSDIGFIKKFKKLFEGGKKKVEEEDDDYEDRIFVTNNMEARYNPKFEAYQNCIQELGLPKDVSLKVIKATYRKMMKSYHPDYHPEQSQEDHDKFIRLSELFKEVFELRKELGFPDEG